MHYSRMRTTRLLTVSQHVLGGVCVSQHALGRSGGFSPGGLPGGVSAQGGCLSGGGVCVADSPPVNRITDRCKNITLPQLRCER